MPGIEAGIATALTYAGDNAHGYELRERDYRIGTDCAGLARLYAAAVEGVSVGSYPEMHTWTMRSVLSKRGWEVVPFSEARMRRGDLLVREDPGGGTGHTVVYLGGRRIVGAEGDWDGRRGDSSGREICERSYYSYGYDHIIRPKEEQQVSIERVDHGLYRMYNAAGGRHHVTASHDEAEALAGLGWMYEGVAGRCADEGEQVYRLYNPFTGEHFYTTGASEAVELACVGWVVEGHAWVAPLDGTPFHRVYNPHAEGGDHLWTTSEEERDALVAAGWAYEGVAFHSA